MGQFGLIRGLDYPPEIQACLAYPCTWERQTSDWRDIPLVFTWVERGNARCACRAQSPHLPPPRHSHATSHTLLPPICPQNREPLSPPSRPVCDHVLTANWYCFLPATVHGRTSLLTRLALAASALLRTSFCFPRFRLVLPPPHIAPNRRTPIMDRRRGPPTPPLRQRSVRASFLTRNTPKSVRPSASFASPPGITTERVCQSSTRNRHPPPLPLISILAPAAPPASGPYPSIHPSSPSASVATHIDNTRRPSRAPAPDMARARASITRPQPCSSSLTSAAAERVG